MRKHGGCIMVPPVNSGKTVFGDEDLFGNIAAAVLNLVLVTVKCEHKVKLSS